MIQPLKTAHHHLMPPAYPIFPLPGHWLKVKKFLAAISFLMIRGIVTTVHIDGFWQMMMRAQTDLKSMMLSIKPIQDKRTSMILCFSQHIYNSTGDHKLRKSLIISSSFNKLHFFFLNQDYAEEDELKVSHFILFIFFSVILVQNE